MQNLTLTIGLLVTILVGFIDGSFLHMKNNVIAKRYLPDSVEDVIGGQNTKKGEAPFQISLMKHFIVGEKHVCGGSFISNRTVITAAHCTYEQNMATLSIRYGTNKKSSSLHPDLKIKKMILHENYNTKTLENDISLLILSSPFQPSDNVDIIEIEMEDLPHDSPVTLYGWGLLVDGKGTDNLQKSEMKIVENKKCNDKWKEINNITDGMICALGDHQSACNGDSGGSLVSKNGKLAGIVSWGASKCIPGEYMNVFTHPKYYASWINANKEE